MTRFPSRRAELDAWLAWRPEWWLAAAAVAAWVTLLGLALAGRSAHELSQPLALPHWTLMSVAMMLPLTLPAARHVGRNSMRRRRVRAMSLYAAAYVLVFVGFGVVALAAVALAEPSPALLVPAVLLVAAAWQLSPYKRRAVLACRRTVPLPPVGRRADTASLRFGLLQGWRCLVSCWPVMLLMAAAGHLHLLVMAVLTVGLLVEERSRRTAELLRPGALAFAAAAVVLAASG